VSCRLTYTAAASTASTSTTSPASPTAAAGGLTAACAIRTGTLAIGTLGLLIRVGLASELDRDLAFEDLLARKLNNSTVGLAGSREIDEGIADRAVGARVLRDRNRLTG
jgi:hypothetical protein